MESILLMKNRIDSNKNMNRAFPVILKDERFNLDKKDNDKIKNLNYELKTIKEIMKSRTLNNFLCEEFFLCGVSTKNSKILFESEDSIAPCKHAECSILPALKAEILSKFPLKNPNFDINSTVNFYYYLDCFSLLPYWS